MCYVPSALYGFLIPGIPGTHDLIMKRHKPPVVLLCVVFLSGQSLSFAALPVSTIYPPVLVANPSASFVLQSILKPRHNALGGQAGPKTGDGGSLQSATSFLTQTLKTVGVSIAQDKISRYGEEHKWNSVWIMVANAALESFVEAAEYVATGDEQDFTKFGREAVDARAPPTNRPGIFTQIKNAIGKGAGWVSDVLKDAGGAIKSVFVSDSGSGAPNAKLTFGLDGKATSYQQQDELGKASIAYGLEAIVDGVSAFTSDTGERQYLNYDPTSGAFLGIDTIGNLGPANYYSPLGDAFNALEDGLTSDTFGYDWGSSTSNINESNLTATYQNYSIFAEFGKYDLFQSANLQSANPILNTVYGSMNTVNNTAAFMLNGILNAGGYVEEWIDNISGTTAEERMFAAANTVGPNPFFYADDALFATEYYIGKGFNLLRNFSRINNSEAAISQKMAKLFGAAGGALKSTFSKSYESLAEANIKNTGVTVLGHYQRVAETYIDKAKRLNASYFDLGKAWDAYKPAQRKVANMHFLDIIAGRGDKILLNVPKSKVRFPSSLADEIKYLLDKKGYRWINQWALRKK